MIKNLKTVARARKFSKEKVSDASLADFLVQLANVYDVKDVGNPPLANALRGLAKSILRKKLLLGTPQVDTSISLYSSSASSVSSSKVKLKVEKPPARRMRMRLSGNFETIKNFTDREVQRFLDDESKTKNELIELAAARFSIPTSQLQRSKVSEIRQTILTALLHETSIDILSEEARREGKARSS